jgi:hypothetical protein
MTDEFELMTQAATRLAAERWHNTAFVLSMQAEAAGTEFDRYWLGREATEAARYASHLDRHVHELAVGNDPLDNLDVEERVTEVRWTATHDTLPSTDTTWQQPRPPAWSAPQPPAWPDLDDELDDAVLDQGAADRAGRAVRAADAAVRELGESDADGDHREHDTQLDLWHMHDVEIERGDEERELS